MTTELPARVAPDEPAGAARVWVAPAVLRLDDLAEAARAIAGAADLADLLRVVTEAAQSLIGTHQAVTSRLVHGWSDASTYVSLSDKYAEYREFDQVPAGLGVLNAVTRENRPLRATGAELQAHPEYRGLRDAPGHPPLPDYLAAPLISRDGRNIGLIQLSDKVDGTGFTDADEAVLVHLAQMASAAMEHVELSSTLERTLGRLGVALDAADTGTWDWDLASKRVTWSPTLERIYGYGPGTFPGTFEAYCEAIHPEDRAPALARIEEALARRERFEYAYRIIRRDGAVRWIQGAGLPVVEVDGALSGLTGACVDVTDRVQAEERLRREHELVETLHRVGQAVTSRRDLDGIVQLVTDAATEVTSAAFGAFFYNVVEPDGEAYQLYTISGVPREAFSGFPMPRNTPIFEPTFRGEGTVRLEDVTADRRFGRNPPYHGMPEGHLPVRSYLAVPVTLSTGEVAGGLFFGHPDPGRFSEDHARLVEGIAGYATIAIENARLIETAQRELQAREQALMERARVAEVLQRSLLPPDLPAIDGLEVAARYRSGSAEVGGDFYDVFPLRARRWGFLIGDVCGKGPDAAALTALARHTVRTAAILERRPAAVLRVLNRALLDRDEPERFCSALYARLTRTPAGARADLFSAGHPRPAVRRADGTVEFLGVAGTLLGITHRPDFGTATVELAPGDVLVLYTDGVTEARREGRFFGEDGLAAALVAVAPRAPLEEFAAALDEAVVAFRDTGRADDVALLLVAAPATSRSMGSTSGTSG